MKKLASLCPLFVCLLLVIFLSGSPLIDLSHLNQSLFSNRSVVGSPVVQAEYVEAYDSLGGRPGIDPLRVDVMSNGSLAIYTWQPDSPGSSTFIYENRYFDDFAWGSNLFLSDGTDQVHMYSDYYQDLPYLRDDYSFTLSSDIGLGVQVVSGDTIMTTWTLLGGVCELRQTITYLPGSTSVNKTFEITNTGSQAEQLTDLRFMHGGDVYFGQEASCSFDDATQTMTVRNLDATIGGLMAMTPGQDSRLGSWYAGWIEDLFYETAGGNLPGTIVDYDEDMGVQLQWNRDVLAAGETWTITLAERFAEEDVEPGETTEVGATTTETTVSDVTTAETVVSEATTTETALPEATTTETLVIGATTTETAAPDATTTETTASDATTTTVSQNATSEQSTITTTTSDQAVPATGESGSCQIIAGGMMLLIAALFCWFKRLQSCH